MRCFVVSIIISGICCLNRHHMILVFIGFDCPVLFPRGCYFPTLHSCASKYDFPVAWQTKYENLCKRWAADCGSCVWKLWLYSLWMCQHWTFVCKILFRMLETIILSCDRTVSDRNGLLNGTTRDTINKCLPFKKVLVAGNSRLKGVIVSLTIIKCDYRSCSYYRITITTTNVIITIALLLRLTHRHTHYIISQLRCIPSTGNTATRPTHTALICHNKSQRR